jgi:hypothetical protein
MEKVDTKCALSLLFIKTCKKQYREQTYIARRIHNTITKIDSANDTKSATKYEKIFFLCSGKWRSWPMDLCWKRGTYLIFGRHDSKQRILHKLIVIFLPPTARTRKTIVRSGNHPCRENNTGNGRRILGQN